MTSISKITLREIASARSGDKGNHANIGVVAKNETAYQFLLPLLTAQAVHEYFRGLGVTKVSRYELPNVQALNFVLDDALAGGASESLRIDTQGKLLGASILNLELPVDEDNLALLRASGWQPQEPTSWNQSSK